MSLAHVSGPMEIFETKKSYGSYCKLNLFLPPPFLGSLLGLLSVSETKILMRSNRERFLICLFSHELSFRSSISHIRAGHDPTRELASQFNQIN